MQLIKTSLKKVFYFIDRKFFSKIFFVSILVTFNTFFELISIGLIFPLTGVILDPNFLNDYILIKNFFYFISPLKFINNDLTFHLISGAITTFLILVIIKNFFVYFYNLYKINFHYKLLVDLRKKSIFRLINLPYNLFSKQNNADLITKVNHLSNITIVTEGLWVICTEGIILISFVILFLLIDPLSSCIIILTLFLVVILLSKFTKKKLLFYGEQRRNHETLQLNFLTNILNGIKEIKLFDKNQYFFNFFDIHSKRGLYADKKFQIISQIPRLFLEVILAFCLSIILIKGMIVGTDYKLIISTTAVFMAAAIRLMPSLNKIIMSMNSIKYYEPVVNKLYEHEKIIRSFELQDKKIIDFKEEILFKNISFEYNEKNKILENVNLKINAGDKIGIIGESGQGKSTFVNILSGLLKQSSGDLLIDGKVINFDFKFNHLSLVPQDPFVSNSSILENLCFGIEKNKINFEKVKNSLITAEIYDFINRQKDKLETVVGEKGTLLSGGQIQRLGIARCLYFDPDILILDEATNALDKKTQKKIIDNLLLNYKSKTIIFISHDYSVLENCNKIFEVKNKKLIKIEKGLKTL